MPCVALLSAACSGAIVTVCQPIVTPKRHRTLKAERPTMPAAGENTRLPRLLTNEPPIFLFRHPVGLAGHLLDAVAVEDDDLIAAGFDQLLPFEALQRLGDAGPPHAEHQRQ